MGDDDVKDFVRNTLGCDCSEEVFGHIENDRDIKAGGITIRNKLNIGNRLLVFIVDASPGLIEILPELIKTGKGERDNKGFNRFRLVLVADDKKLKKAAHEAFEALPDADERVHLHVVGKDEALHV